MDQDQTAARIVAGTQDAVIYADHSGIIRMWNVGAQRIFGWTPEEAVGETLDIIVPEKHRKAHWRGWGRVMDTGLTRYGADPLAVPGLRKDSSTVSLEFSITMLKDSEGEIEGVAAILRDVTKRWNRERALHARVRELESGEE